MSAAPVEVELRIMDSSRTPTRGVLTARNLGLAERVVRGLKRLALVCGVGLVVAVLPLLHLCGAAVALVVGPVAGVLAFKVTALLEAGAVACPKCAAQVMLEAGTTGWPARLHCDTCGSTFDATPAVPVRAAPGSSPTP